MAGKTILFLFLLRSVLHARKHFADRAKIGNFLYICTFFNMGKYVYRHYRKDWENC